MNTNFVKPEAIWADACLGSSYAFTPELSMSRDQHILDSGWRPGGELRLGVKAAVHGSARLRDLQRVQDQGLSVPSFLSFEEEHMTVPTAQKPATANGGVSGPYPWRHPA